jgi:hypothetical protein
MNQSPSTIPQFKFLNLHPQLFIDTASDRYAGWLGQIYTPEKYQGRITRRTNLHHLLMLARQSDEITYQRLRTGKRLEMKS